ncbi:MAG: hypothetical protein LBG79_07085 [Spirochaetaceae bacterium]|jgi:hypothetical protein|nr:hypothetical protein [Spirochaetaceae bacterium]
MDFFSRIAGVAVLVAFSWTTFSCGGPIDEDIIKPVVVTPGEGTPRYLYINTDGSESENDCGLTGFFIENNKNAEGVVIVADVSQSEDCVSVYNPHNQSTMFFYYKKNSVFPYLMVIKSTGEEYLVWFSDYRTDEQKYNIVFQHGLEFESEQDFVLNREVLALYADDPNLSDGQNRRLRLITNSLGLGGSIAAMFDVLEKRGDVKIDGRAAMARSFWGGISYCLAGTFRAIPFVAAVVAVVVTPVVNIISSASGNISSNCFIEIADTENQITGGFYLLADMLDRQESGGENPQQIKFVTVKLNGQLVSNGQEFHVGYSDELLFDIVAIGLNNSTITVNNFIAPYETGTAGVTNNSIFFENSIERNGARDRFQFRVKRYRQGYDATGKISWGIKLTDSDISVNNSSDGVLYKTPSDNQEKIYKNLVVLRACINPFCPDYVH